jgi:nuclear pore complex protein Nup98-Nup96
MSFGGGFGGFGQNNNNQQSGGFGGFGSNNANTTSGMSLCISGGFGRGFAMHLTNSLLAFGANTGGTPAFGANAGTSSGGLFGGSGTGGFGTSGGT